jgi:hypothetical protein
LNSHRPSGHGQNVAEEMMVDLNALLWREKRSGRWSSNVSAASLFVIALTLVGTLTMVAFPSARKSAEQHYPAQDKVCVYSDCALDPYDFYTQTMLKHRQLKPVEVNSPMIRNPMLSSQLPTP